MHKKGKQYVKCFPFLFLTDRSVNDHDGHLQSQFQWQ